MLNPCIAALPVGFQQARPPFFSFFFSLSLQPSILTIERLNLGQIPPVCGELHAHTCTSPSFQPLRSTERRVAESPPSVSCRLSLPHIKIPLLRLSGSDSHVEPRVLETDTDRARSREKENMGSLGGAAVHIQPSRLYSNLAWSGAD